MKQMTPVQRGNASMKKCLVAGCMACTLVFAGGVTLFADAVLDNGDVQMGSNQETHTTRIGSGRPPGGGGSGLPNVPGAE